MNLARTFVRVKLVLHTTSKTRMKVSQVFKNFWVREVAYLVFVFVIFTIPADNIVIALFLGSLFINFCIYYAHAQINRFFILPLWLEKKQFLRFLIFSLINLTCFTIFSMVVNPIILQDLLIKYPETTITALSEATTMVMSLMVISSIAFVERMYKNQKAELELKQRLHQLEVKQLRDQLNPHFLFNALNNLYGVSLGEPHRVSDMIMQFSQLMRYSLESIKTNFAKLSDEIEFIDSYIAIESERVTARCTVIYNNTVTETTLKTKEIAPLIFLPLIENAFKYGASGIAHSNINISITENEHFLILEITNTAKNIIVNPQTSTMTGIQNTVRRLAMIYPEKHTFSAAKQSDDTFHTFLKIQL
jgi:two-component system, LytTR family, sensor kinase